MIIYNNPTPIKIFPATESEEIEQNVRTLLNVFAGETPNYREFGFTSTLYGLPLQTAETLLFSEFVSALETYEPRAELTDARIKFYSDLGKMEIELEVNYV
jgi:phage baseplate assembly protein W